MARDSHYDLYRKNKSSELKGLRRFLEFVFIVALKKFISLWPVRWSQKMGAGFGKLIFRIAVKDKGIAKYQLDFCFPELSEDKRNQLLKEIFENAGKTLFEALAINKIRANAEKWIKLENTQVIHQALERKNGAVLLFGHIGNWELLSIVYEMANIKGIAAESPIGDNRLDNLLLSARKSDNLEIIPRKDKKSARAILNCFRNNKVFLYGFDQDTKVKSVFVDFFGRQASTAKGAATIAQKFNAPVISAFGARMVDGTHKYSFELLSQPPYSGNEKEEQRLTQLYTTALEKHIRNFPSQWVWFHRRWKTQPENSNIHTKSQVS